MRISLFPGDQANQTANAKKVVTLPLVQLTEVICKRSWSPTIFNEEPYTNPKGQKKGKFYRSNKNVEAMEGIGLDFDGGCTIEEVKAILAKNNLAGIIGTTRNHQKVKVTKSGKKKPACDRFRVILKFDRPLRSDDELKKLWPKISRIFPMIDESCKDAARFFYPCKEIVAVTQGIDFPTQPDPIHAEDHPVVGVSVNKGHPAVTATKTPSQRGLLAQATMRFITFGADDGEWHRAFFKAGIDLKEQGYSIDEARNMLRKASTNPKRDLDEEDLYQLNDIYQNREPKYKPRFANTNYQLQPVTEWPPVKDLPSALPSVPPMPIDLIPHLLREFVKDVSERMQTPPEMVIGPLLASVATLVGRRLGVRPKRNDTSWIVVAVIWNLIVARPSRKKTPSIRAAIKGLNEIEKEALAEFRAQYATTRSNDEFHQSKISGIREQVKKTSKTEGKDAELSKLKSRLSEAIQEYEASKVTQRRYITNDATVEKLHEILRENPNGMALIRDELEGWARSLDKQGREGDREFYLEAWDGLESKTVDRIGRGSIHASAMCVHIVGGMQPGKFEKYVYDANNGGRGDDGLLQRFQLLFYPDQNVRMPYVDRKPNQAANQKVIDLFKWLESTDLRTFDSGSTDPVPTIRFSASAQEVFDCWMQKLENELHEKGEKYGGAVESHFGKYRSLMPALALLFHLIDGIG